MRTARGYTDMGGVQLVNDTRGDFDPALTIIRWHGER